MKRVYIIRHAKSSWSNPDLSDFDRPLNKRGKSNGPMMAERLFKSGIIPQRIISSPAKRAKKTAKCIADGTGFKKIDIVYDKGLYLAGISYFLDTIENNLSEIDLLFVVGHNSTVTDLAEYLTGERFSNIPTCGIVGIEYKGSKGFKKNQGAGSLCYYDFPKKIHP